MDGVIGAKEGVALELEGASITSISRNSSFLRAPNRCILTSSLTEMFLGTPNTTAKVAGVPVSLQIYTRSPSLDISKCSFFDLPSFFALR